MNKVPTLAELDFLRETSSRATENYRKVLRDEYNGLLPGYERANIELEAHAIKCEAENAVLRALVIRWSCPPCPFCNGGLLVPTPTKGRLSCDQCQSIALVGKGCTLKELTHAAQEG